MDALAESRTERLDRGGVVAKHEFRRFIFRQALSWIPKAFRPGQMLWISSEYNVCVNFLKIFLPPNIWGVAFVYSPTNGVKMAPRAE